MRARTRKKRRISSAAALREAEGAVPRDRESGRSRPLPEAGSAVLGVAEEQACPPPGDSAVFFPGHRPADWVPEVPPVARLGAPLEARHRPPVAADSESEPAARPPPPGLPRAVVPQKRQPESLQDPRALESRGERDPRAGGRKAGGKKSGTRKSARKSSRGGVARKSSARRAGSSRSKGGVKARGR